MTEWSFRDDEGETHGFYDTDTIKSWLEDGYVASDTEVQRRADTERGVEEFEWLGMVDELIDQGYTQESSWYYMVEPDGEEHGPFGLYILRAWMKFTCNQRNICVSLFVSITIIMVLGSLKLYTQLLSSFHQVQVFSFSSTDSIILTGHFITKTNATFCTLNLANSQTGRSQPFCGGMNNSDGPEILKMQQIYLKASMVSEEKLTQEEMLNTLADMALKTYAATEMANM